jgi:PKD repeat protein
MTDGTNTFDVWIDGDTELYNGGVIEGTFTLTGIVEQMDNASPFDNNYVILPRYNEDIVDQVVADFVIPSPIVYGNGGVTIDITNNSVGASSFEWDFGNGDTTEGEVAEYTYSFEALSSLAEISVTLIATGANCTSTTTQTVDLVYSNIEEQDAFELSLYPVPANTMMTLQSAELLEQLQVLDIAGRVVMSLDKLNVYSVNLNVSALANGQYIVRAYSSNAAVVKSFVVSK